MKPSPDLQNGVILIEAMMGILVFSLGVLAMVALGSVAVSGETDSRSRTDAANLANEIVSEIALRADRIHSDDEDPAVVLGKLNTSLAAYAHQVEGGGCDFSGDQSTNEFVTAWRDKVLRTLPGSMEKHLQIDTTSSELTAFSAVRVRICWQAPSDRVVRSLSLVSYVN